MPEPAAVSAATLNPLIPFVLGVRGVRGYAVRLTEGLDSMFNWREYPPAVAALLGQALAAMPMLAADLTQDAYMNLQFQGKHALKLLVAQVDQHLQLRGMAKFSPDAKGAYAELTAGGLLACLLEPRHGVERYQAVVEASGHSLAESLENYFRQSEQLPTLIRLAAGGRALAGILLQRLPEGAGLDDAHWQHVQTLFATLDEAELLATEPLTLLSRLFAEDEVRVFEARPVRLRCRCDRVSISTMLLSLGEAEVADVLREQGKVEVTCEFCGKHYSYAELEMRELFDGARLSNPENRTRQ
ncbi:MAG TPA: Hsp33 family molecular chaperone HslO [Stenotrophobium sp.]|nr:Hsp33 family molecular chaperone HslO [Stenotrophobium sp.]